MNFLRLKSRRRLGDAFTLKLAVNLGIANEDFRLRMRGHARGTLSSHKDHDGFLVIHFCM